MENTVESRAGVLDSFHARSQPDQPISIYEMHLNSWMRVPEDGNRPLTCAEIAPKIAAYMRFLRFTHVCLHADGTGDPPCLEAIRHSLQTVGVELLPQPRPDFDYQWDTLWASNILDYFAFDPPWRKFHHELLLRTGDRSLGKFILPLSHDVVIPGRRSLLARMPGDDWQKFANLRLLLALTYALPGKKLLFMGGEFAQWNAWDPATSLDWHLVQPGNRHAQMQSWVSHLNGIYRHAAPLSQCDFADSGFTWLETADAEHSVITFLRRGQNPDDTILCVMNLLPEPRFNYRIGAPASGFWKEILNSDAAEYGGSGRGNLGGVEAAPFGWHYQPRSLNITLPPLAALFFRR